MALADVYDALVSERPYKKAFSHAEAVKIIQDDQGAQFDPVLTEVFVAVIGG
jgi:putative two-component system response regulator